MGRYSPSNVLLGTNRPYIARGGARHRWDEHVADSNREGVGEGEEGKDEGEHGELHDGLEHGGYVVKRRRRQCSRRFVCKWA